jgi:hypothetical protein
VDSYLTKRIHIHVKKYAVCCLRFNASILTGLRSKD